MRSCNLQMTTAPQTKRSNYQKRQLLTFKNHEAVNMAQGKGKDLMSGKWIFCASRQVYFLLWSCIELASSFHDIISLRSFRGSHGHGVQMLMQGLEREDNPLLTLLLFYLRADLCYVPAQHNFMPNGSERQLLTLRLQMREFHQMFPLRALSAAIPLLS